MTKPLGGEVGHEHDVALYAEVRPDTYGEGVRDSKATVQAIIGRALATTKEPGDG